MVWENTGTSRHIDGSFTRIEGICRENESRNDQNNLKQRQIDSRLQPVHQNKTHNTFYACLIVGGKPCQEIVKFPKSGGFYFLSSDASNCLRLVHVTFDISLTTNPRGKDAYNFSFVTR